MLKKYCVVHIHERKWKEGFDGLRIMTRDEHTPYTSQVITDADTYDEACQKLRKLINIGLDSFFDQCLKKDNSNKGSNEIIDWNDNPSAWF